MGKSTSKKLVAWRRRKLRVRRGLSGTAGRPRLSIFRSTKHMYAQVIDDVLGTTLAAASTLDNAISGGEHLKKADAARRVGELLAARCLEAKIEAVVFDRNGYPYRSGRVSALAEGARSGGLKF
jgi:large subunit ribosomal protein L18